MALSDMYRWPMFPANSGFLVNAQTGEHVKSVPRRRHREHVW